MNKPRPQTHNSSNLFHGVSRKTGGLVINLQKFKNYYQKMSHVVGLTIIKSANPSFKENQSPHQRNDQKNQNRNKQQDLINHSQFNAKNFKIRSLKLKNITTIDPIPTSKRVKNFILQLKQIQCQQQILKMCHKMQFKKSQQLNYEKCKWGIIIDSQLFMNPKVFWKEKLSNNYSKRTVYAQKHSRIKSEILDRFLQNIQNLADQQNQLRVYFRVRQNDEMSQLQSYLISTKQKYCGIFHIQKKPIQSLIFYNLRQLGNLPQNLIFFEEKHKNCIYLPFIQKNNRSPKAVYLLIDSILKHHGANLIQKINFNEKSMSVNGNLLFQEHLNKYGINQRIQINTNRIIKRSSRKSCRYKSNSDLTPFNISYQDNSLQRLEEFKDKMVRYIKIMQEEKKKKIPLSIYSYTSSSQQIKTIREANVYSSNSNYENSGNICYQNKNPISYNNCLNNISPYQSYPSINSSCKTPNQIIAQLIKLNSFNCKQIDGFYRSTKQIQLIKNNTKQSQQIIMNQQRLNEDALKRIIKLDKVSYQMPIFRMV